MSEPSPYYKDKNWKYRKLWRNLDVFEKKIEELRSMVRDVKTPDYDTNVKVQGRLNELTAYVYELRDSIEFSETLLEEIKGMGLD